jgi:hypothetical protein
MGRVIVFSSLVAAAAFLVLRLTSSTPAAPHHFSASEMLVAAGFVTLAIAALLRD